MRRVLGEASAFTRFLLVGGTFSLIYSLTTSALIGFAGTPPFVTSVLVYLMCIPPAFLAQRSFAFRVEKTRPAAFAIYAATQIASLSAVSLVTTRFVTGIFAFDTALFLVTAGCAAVLSYLVGRFVAFRPPA